MKQVYTDISSCCGCGGCVALCPRGAISMKEDAEGYLYPVIDGLLCIDCGACVKFCEKAKAVKNEPQTTVYAVQSKNGEILKRSQSGGIFAELAGYVLSLGGTVYGAAFDGNFDVSHIRITSKEELCRLQGSKYVQGRTDGSFSSVADDLKNGKTVLFSGTPCQVAAAKTLCADFCDDLFTVDLVCHGVLPPKLWRDYLGYMRKKHGEVTSANFRDKKYGWGKCFETFTAGGKEYKADIWRRIFSSECFLRPSCYGTDGDDAVVQCGFGGVARVGDISVGDFWGLPGQAAENFENTSDGVSLVFVNTEKGRRLFDAVADGVRITERPVSEATRANSSLAEIKNATHVQKNAVDAAHEGYRRRGFRFVMKKYADKSIGGYIRRGKRFIKSCLKKR